MNETLVEHVLNCCAGNGFEKPITHKSRSCIKGKWLPCHDGSNSCLNRNFLSPWYEYVQSWEFIHGCKAALYLLSPALTPWGRGTIEFAIVCPSVCLPVCPSNFNTCMLHSMPSFLWCQCNTIMAGDTRAMRTLVLIVFNCPVLYFNFTHISY